jgi:hypothetical protein
MVSFINGTKLPLKAACERAFHIIISLHQNIMIQHADLINYVRLVERSKKYKILEPDVQCDFNDMLVIMLHFLESNKQQIDTLDVATYLSCEVYTNQKNVKDLWYDFWCKDCKIKIVTSNRIDFHYALMYFADHELTCILYFKLAYLVLC